MEPMEVLWVDDDSPEQVEGVEGVKVITAQSCEQADKLLSSGQVKPAWAVVDLIVPQGSWGGKVKKIPGLDFINHLKRTYGDKIGIVAFSIVMPDDIRDQALRAGASEAVAKSAKSWASILQDLRKRSSNF